MVGPETWAAVGLCQLCPGRVVLMVEQAAEGLEALQAAKLPGRPWLQDESGFWEAPGAALPAQAQHCGLQVACPVPLGFDCDPADGGVSGAGGRTACGSPELSDGVCADGDGFAHPTAHHPHVHPKS